MRSCMNFGVVMQQVLENLYAYLKDYYNSKVPTHLVEEAKQWFDAKRPSADKTHAECVRAYHKWQVWNWTTKAD